MERITIKDLIKIVKSYNPDEEERVLLAYEYAKEKHKGQVRQSGEEYITHPLNVALILAEMHADGDTLCAALLHDVLEDTNSTQEEITELFNGEVAKLVDGVTKLSKMNFSSKEECNLANTRKIITGIMEDVRIIIIKLADRLHNMRTLGFKSSFKQKENALETMEIFVPLAYYIGEYRIKSELEDLSLRYLKPEEYKKTEELKLSTEDDLKEIIEEMLYKITAILKDNDIPNEIKVRTKNIYGIYKQLKQGQQLNDIHDLIALKIMAREVDDCYRILRWIHYLYHPVNARFKDYICNPKTNLYQSLHSTIFGPKDKLVHTQIRTFDMDKVASFGVTAHWDIEKGEARVKMQEDLKERCQFIEPLQDMNFSYYDNKEFVECVKKELFSDKVYVYTPKGKVFEFPKGATPIDFAYRVHTDVGNTMVGVLVNEQVVGFDYHLKSNDIVRIVTSDDAKPQENWYSLAVTSYARQRIKRSNK